VLRILLVLALASGFAFPNAQRCRAQARSDSAREPDGYKAAIDNALAEFDSSNFAEAREHFIRAHTLFPNARTLRGLGMIEFELRNYVDALTYLEQALASPVKALEGQLRSETQALLVRARGYVGTVKLSLLPEHASIEVDGFPLADGVHRELRLPVGDHVIEFQAEGYQNARRAFKLHGEELLTLDVKLLTRAAVASDEERRRAGSRTDPPVEPQAPVYKRWWLWTTVGVVLAGGAVAAVLLSTKTQREEQPVLTSNTPPNATIEPWRAF
jgi:tetratricopeptide (TPR) repeat protein